MNTKVKFYNIFYNFSFMIILVINSPVRAELIKGQISMSDKLGPLPPNIRVGKKYNDNILPQMKNSQTWICIPSWMAGTFHRETQVYYSQHGPASILSRSVNDKQSGQQLDKRGQVWNHTSLPTIARIELSKYDEVQIITASEPISIKSHEVITLKRATTIDINKKTSKIARIEMKEQLLFLTPMASGKIFVDAYIRTFKQNGKKDKSQHSQTEYTLLRLFHPLDVDPETGLNLKQDLKNYLIAHQLDYLIPSN